MAKSLGDQLTEIDNAISTITTTNQSYKYNGMEYNRANITALYSIKSEILNKISIHGPNYIEGLKKSARSAKIAWGAN